MSADNVPTIEWRDVCSKCNQDYGLFHKGCDGEWVEESRTVTPWRRAAPRRPDATRERGIRLTDYEARLLRGPEPTEDGAS